MHGVMLAMTVSARTCTIPHETHERDPCLHLSIPRLSRAYPPVLVPFAPFYPTFSLSIPPYTLLSNVVYPAPNNRRNCHWPIRRVMIRRPPDQVGYDR